LVSVSAVVLLFGIAVARGTFALVSSTHDFEIASLLISAYVLGLALLVLVDTLVQAGSLRNLVAWLTSCSFLAAVVWLAITIWRYTAQLDEDGLRMLGAAIFVLIACVLWAGRLPKLSRRSGKGRSGHAPVTDGQ